MPFALRIAGRTAILVVAVALVWGTVSFGQDEDPLADETGWIHEDIEAGYARSIATGKPLLVAFK